MRKISFALLLIPALAWGQPKSAEDWYEEGSNQYNLGNFDKAIDAFKQGFALEPDESKKANYLYNVGQAYRQTHDCKNALFFYKRFLALKANDTVKPIPARKRKEVEDFITQLDACVRQQTQVSEKPPVNNIPPEGDGDKGKDARRETPRKEVAQTPPGTVPSSGPGGDDDDSGGSVTAPGVVGAPHMISVRFTGGGTQVSAGGNAVPVQATFALVGGYPIPINDKLTVEAGAAFTFTPVPFEFTAMGSTVTQSKTGQLWSLMANGAATYEVYPKVGLRGDLGLGALFFANIDESPFTGGQMTSGALTMFHLRAAVSADYAITPNLVLTATPVAFTWSPPKAGLADDIKSITSIDFMIGIGYRK
jgi:hypothetical protein